MTTHRNMADYFAGIPTYTHQLAAENDRLRAAIREALASTMLGIAPEPRRILAAALKDEGAES